MALVAALDLATTTGVAIGAVMARPEHYTVQLGTGDAPERGAAIIRLVQGLVAQRGVTEIVIEAPILAMGSAKSAGALRFLIGAAAIARAACGLLGVPSSEIAVVSVRKHFLGCVPKGRDASKAAILSRCKMLGWAPGNDNEADALALLDCRLAQLSAHHVAQRPARMFTRQS